MEGQAQAMPPAAPPVGLMGLLAPSSRPVLVHVLEQAQMQALAGPPAPCPSKLSPHQLRTTRNGPLEGCTTTAQAKKTKRQLTLYSLARKQLPLTVRAVQKEQAALPRAPALASPPANVHDIYWPDPMPAKRAWSQAQVGTPGPGLQPIKAAKAMQLRVGAPPRAHPLHSCPTPTSRMHMARHTRGAQQPPCTPLRGPGLVAPLARVKARRWAPRPCPTEALLRRALRKCAHVPLKGHLKAQAW